MDYLQVICQPVDEETACGHDFSDDNSFQNFILLAEGKPERFDGKNTLPAEPPDWSEIKKQAYTYLAQTKDLKLMSILAQAALNSDGLVAFEQCLHGISDTINEHWQNVFPALDEDDNDPQARLSAIGYLSDNNFVLNSLKSYPLAKSKVLGIVSLNDFDSATDETQIKAIFNDSERAAINLLHDTVQLCLNHLAAINNSFVDNAGNEYCVNFEHLTKLLSHIQKTIADYVSIPNANPDAIDEASAVTESDDNNTGISAASAANQLFDTNMRLTSQAEVAQCLDLICQYFEEHEPSSPIPLLINRAKKLINLDFMEIIEEMAPEATEQLNKLAGLSK